MRHSLSRFAGTLTYTSAMAAMGAGTEGMFETMIVTLLVASISALMKEHGGFEAILDFIRHRFNGRRGGMLGIALLTAFMDVATANNTVAIVIAAPIARDISREFGVRPTTTASLLDTCSCIMQGIIPFLFYPFLLTLFIGLSIARGE